MTDIGLSGSGGDSGDEEFSSYSEGEEDSGQSGSSSSSEEVQAAARKRKRSDSSESSGDGDSSDSSQGSPQPKRRKVASPDTSSSDGSGSSGSSSSGSSGSSGSEDDGDDGDETGTYRPDSESEDDETADSQSTTALDGYVRQFIASAVTWANANADRIRTAYRSAGGWEVWLEVELYLQLVADGATVSRQPPYAIDRSGGRADLYMGDSVLVEMKVETHDETVNSFVGRVVRDRKKVEKAGARPATVVAIVFDDNTADAMEHEFTSDGVAAGPLRLFWDATTGL
jgi:hypothetical protein